MRAEVMSAVGGLEGLTPTEWERLESWRTSVYAEFGHETRRIAYAMTTSLARKLDTKHLTVLEIQGELTRQHHERRKQTIEKHLRELEKWGFVKVTDTYPTRYAPIITTPTKLLVTLPSKWKGSSVNTVLHKDDKNNFAIVTTAESEEAFRGQLAAALDEMIRDGRYENDWPFHLDGWIEQASEVICKFRGYKSHVVERRTIIAGVLDPDAAAIEVGYQTHTANGASI